MTASIGQIYSLQSGYWVCPGRPPIPVEQVHRYGRIARVRTKAMGAVADPDIFVLRETKPVASNTGVPSGTSLTAVTTDAQISAGSTVSNIDFQAYVDVAANGGTTTFTNCRFSGRAPGGQFRFGLVTGSGGGRFERCTFSATPQSATFYRNGINCSGGAWTMNRCDVSNVVDVWHKTLGGTMTMTGCYAHDYSFFDGSTGTDHPDPPYAGWVHADSGGQALSGGGGDRIEGNNIQAFFNVDGVVWVNGVASGGLIGTPSTALNGGFPNRNYGNLITYSNSSGFTNVYIGYNWLNGGNAPSGMIQFTTGSGHSLTFEGNRFGLDGAPSSAGKIFLATWPAGGMTLSLGAPNVFDDLPSTPRLLKPTNGIYVPITGSASGYSVIPANYS